MEFLQNPAVEEVLNSYPPKIRKKIKTLRSLLVDSADKTEGLKTLEETLKWGEPSYISNIGSTIRIAWSSKQPDTYRLFFICTTKLVDTFKEIYGDTFNYESNRALVFHLDNILPEQELRHCCTLALSYHKIKHLPLLGA